MGVILILAALLGGGAYYVTRKEQLGADTPDTGSDLTKAALEAAKNPDKLSPDALDKLSDRLRGSGFKKTADALALKADVKRELTGAAPVPAVPGSTIKPPIPVKAEAWTRYTKWAIRGKKDTVTNDGRFGYFLMFLRTLVDIGYMINERRVQDPKTRKMVYKADWKPPMTREVFLGDPKLQYLAFGASSRRNATLIAKSYKQLIGSEIEGQKATLSGLMGVMQVVGPTGFDGWVKVPATRKPATNAAYLSANGIF